MSWLKKTIKSKYDWIADEVLDEWYMKQRLKKIKKIINRMNEKII